MSSIKTTEKYYDYDWNDDAVLIKNTVLLE